MIVGNTKDVKDYSSFFLAIFIAIARIHEHYIKSPRVDDFHYLLCGSSCEKVSN
jgi:hypothetical protein